jgi:DNA invertase Pin-like site-specific DNA recombinase
MKALIYARVSSKEQEETGYSLDSQVKLLHDYASRRSFDIRKVYKISESASGRQLRTTFDEMLRFATQHRIPVILCEKIDRLTRNLKDASIIDDWVKADAQREVHFAKESFVVNNATKAHDSLVWDMKVAIARFYTNNLSEEVRKGQKEKIAQGWLPTKPPLGYKTIGEQGRKIHVVNESVAPLVRRMFDLYATGNYSLKRLNQVMRAEGLRNSAGGRLSRSRLHTLLSYPFYYGQIPWNGVLHRGQHEPLISRELFDVVQEKLHRKTASPQYRKHLPVFKSKVQCAECRGPLAWEIQRGHWYGHCNHYRKCSQKTYLRQDRLEEQLLPLFDRAAPKNSRVLHWLERALKEAHQDKITYHSTQRDSHTKLIAQLDRRLETLYDDKADGRIPPDFYNRKFQEWTEEKERLLDKLNNLSQANTQYYRAVYAIHELAAKATTIYQSPKATSEDRRLLLSYAFSNIRLEGTSVAADYTTAFDFLVQWVPKLNNIFEQTQKATQSGLISVLPPFGTNKNDQSRRNLENNFRTSKTHGLKPRFVESALESRLLLAWLDAFRTYDWERALPAPEALIAQMERLLALVPFAPIMEPGARVVKR